MDVEHKSFRTKSDILKLKLMIMKIAAVLFILSVCYIASTEQAAAPAGVHTYPSRPWKEMER